MSIYATYYKNGYKAIDRDNYYKLYLEDTIKLARTLIVKSEYTAIKQNEYLSIAYPGSFDPDDPTTWKYYRNLAGLRFPVDWNNLNNLDSKQDPNIIVTSLDTQIPISFTRENLEVNPATKAAYAFGSRYYKELLLRYPGHEDIILGVLYPVDINKAIAAKDFSILNYQKELVEENEISLIPNIQEWLYNFDVRWNNKQFTLSDSLYGVACFGVMSMQLLPLILNLRLRACHTFEAHSFHVKQYLASHGGLDRYLPYMTLKQALFFYRNIAYIERNNGKRDTFSWLTEKVLTDRQIPLSEYKMHHSDAVMPDSYTPEIYFNKDPLNEYANDAKNLTAKYSVRKVLDKEQPLAPDNERYSSSNFNQIEKLFEHSLSNELYTKVLESSMTDYTDAIPHTLHQVFLNHWMHFISTNRFNSHYISIKDPLNGATIQIRSDVAFWYYVYAYAKSLGFEPVVMPPLHCIRIRREPIPENYDLYEIAGENYYSESIHSHVSYLLSKLEPIGSVQSIQEFRDTCNHIYASLQKQMYCVYEEEPISRRAMTYAMVNRCYEDKYYPPVDQNEEYHKKWLLLTEEDIKDAYEKGKFTGKVKRISPGVYDPTFIEFENDPIKRTTRLALGEDETYDEWLLRYKDPKDPDYPKDPEYLPNKEWLKEFKENTPYAEWLQKKGLNTSYTEKEEWEAIYNSIYEQITGVELNGVSEAGKLQEAMINLFAQLSSYSVHFIHDINRQAIHNPAFNTVRLEFNSGKGKIADQILLGIWKIFKRRIRPKDYEFIELPYLFIGSFTTVGKDQENEFIQIPIDVFPSTNKGKQADVIDLGILRVNQETLPLPDESTLEENPNYAAYFSMTDEEKAAILNVYCNCPEPYYEPSTVDINDIMPVTHIPAFDYTKPLWQHMNMFNYQWIPYSTVYFNVDSHHIDLDCFYPNIGNENLPHFVLHTGIIKVDPV